MDSTAQTVTLNSTIMAKNNLSKIVHLLDLVKTTKERFVLPDYNAVVMNMEDYEDMLFDSNPRIQKEIKQELEEYKKTGGINYMEYRKERLKG